MVVAGVAAALLIAGAAFFLLRPQGPSAAKAARDYLDAWQESDFTSMEKVLLNRVPNFKSIHESLKKDLAVTGAKFELRDVAEEDDGARVPFKVTWTMRNAGTWSYDSAMELVLREDRWLVAWTPAVIHPKLTEATSFQRVRTWPTRGEIQSFDGKPIAGPRQVVTVGIEPRRIKDRAAMVQALVDNLAADPAKVNADLDQPGLRGDWFLPVADITPERYAEIKPAIYPVPGLVFQNTQKRAVPGPGFAQHVVGKIGEITEELLDKLGAPYEVGDQVGLTGLEGVFERTLAGKPAIEFRAGDEVLHRIEGEPSQPVRTTLSLEAQSAAEAALAGVANPAGIVVVDAPTSEIRAVVSRPLDQFNRAMSGKYPPGSSFKIVTSAALLASGASVDEPVDCPAELKVGGKTFKNFESEALGRTTFAQSFIHSCNTAFIGLEQAKDTKLAEMAKQFGFGARYDLPLNAAGGSFPEPRDSAERAAAAIGQARVLASPLHMATVAAAVASGAWRAPRLLQETPVVDPTQIDPAVAGALRTLMASAVRDGTGVRAQVPGKEVAGKTGTAEFGQEVPPKTHAWFVGYSGRYAFAVLVEDGGVGGEVAAPLAAKLVTGLGG